METTVSKNSKTTQKKCPSWLNPRTVSLTLSIYCAQIEAEPKSYNKAEEKAIKHLKTAAKENNEKINTNEAKQLFNAHCKKSVYLKIMARSYN